VGDGFHGRSHVRKHRALRLFTGQAKKESTAMASTVRELISERDKLEGEVEALRLKIESLDLARRLGLTRLGRLPLRAKIGPACPRHLLAFSRPLARTA
jgi:hypothetical protein